MRADGYTYFSIYRAHAIWYSSAEGVRYPYAATPDDSEPPIFTVFAESFDAIRARLDEIVGA